MHLGTGNYHERTARLYTDFGLFTCDEVIGNDVSKLFLQLTSLGRVTKLRKLLQSPFTAHKELLHKIEREIEHACKGKTARIMVKMNALVEPTIIQALYRASQAGVKIDLIVRGICCLRPGVPGMSENIHVRSVIGRFLEHTRVFWFSNDGKDDVYCASADWMDRNFFRRVEAVFPIEDKALHARVVKEALYTYLADNTQAWVLQPDGRYLRLAPDGAEPVSAQATLLRELAQAP